MMYIQKGKKDQPKIYTWRGRERERDSRCSTTVLQQRATFPQLLNVQKVQKVSTCCATFTPDSVLQTAAHILLHFGFGPVCYALLELLHPGSVDDSASSSILV